MIPIERKMKKSVPVSAGCLIILNKKKVLLGHPTNNSWNNCYSPPKGGVDAGESLLQAALRETREEMSIDIRLSQISNKENPIQVDYYKKKELFKQVYLYVVSINSISEIGMETEILDKSRLQITELDWAGFLTKKEAQPKIFFRFWPVIEKMLED